MAGGFSVSKRRVIDPTQWIYLLLHALLFAVGIALYQVHGAWAFAVATALMATGVTGWVLFLWIRQNEDTARSLRMMRDLGMTTVFATRSVAIRSEYEPRFSTARDQIAILGFGLRALREDFGGQFAGWARHARVRILLLDPDAPMGGESFADLRDLEEHNPVGSIRADVKSFLDATKALRTDFPNSFQIRLYRCIPSINVCIIDDEVFWGPYVHGRQSRNTVTFLCRAGGTMAVMLTEHFEAIWGDPVMSSAAS